MLVQESLDDFEIRQFATDAGNQLSEAIKEDHKEELNEAVAMLALSTVLAAPAFVKILGTMIKKGAKLFNWKGGENGGKKLEEFAHKAEKWLQRPIKWTLEKLGVDKEKSEKWTKGIFALVIILLGIYSGVAAVQAYKAANVATATAEGMLTGLKASETGETLLSAINAAGSAAKGAV
jgi:hypothetical protein